MDKAVPLPTALKYIYIYIIIQKNSILGSCWACEKAGLLDRPDHQKCGGKKYNGLGANHG